MALFAILILVVVLAALVIAGVAIVVVMLSRRPSDPSSTISPSREPRPLDHPPGDR